MRALIALLGAGLVVAFAPNLATAAPAYPIHHCDVSINPPSGQVKSGHTFTVSGSYYISTTWTVQFNGKTRTFVGATFTTTLRAPKTTHNETLVLRVSCSAEPGQSTPFNIEVLGASSNNGHHLPNTGGPSIWWLIFAGLAGASGSYLMWRGRRRPKALPVASSEGKHVLRP